MSNTSPLSECEVGLKCFQRDAYTSVPGCEGSGQDDYDYCIKPETTGLEGTPCSEGIYLRPSELENGNGINVDVQVLTRGICVWVEVADERDGGFPSSLPGIQGFVRYDTSGTNFAVTDSTNTNGEDLAIDLFCTGRDHVTLPATSTTITSHGICTL